MNSGDILILFYCIVAIAILGLFVFRFKRAILINNFFANRVQRNLIYCIVALIGAAFFGFWGATSRDNSIFFLASISTELMIYFSLCGTYLTVHEIPPRLLVRPIAFLLLLATCVFELFSFVMAGSEAFNRISMANAAELATNTWLWLGLIATLFYVFGGMLIYLVELKEGLGKLSGDSRLNLRYRIVNLLVVGIVGVAYFANELLRTLAYKFFDSTVPGETLTNLRTFLLTVALILFTSQFMAAKPLYRIYATLYAFSMRKYLAKVLRLYDGLLPYADIVFLPTLKPEDKSAPKPTFVLAHLADGLDSFSNLLWKAQAWEQAKKSSKCFEAGQAKNCSVSFNEEVAIWLHYLKNEEGIAVLREVAKQYIPLAVVPPRPQLILEERARHYARLSDRLRKDLENPLVASQIEKEYING
jgi:hypothetical protein